jgi:hypothetical protein
MALQSLPDKTLTALPVALSATSKKAAWVQVQANSLAGAARIGDRNITASRGGIIASGGDYQFSPTLGNANAYDLSDIYVLGTPGDTIAILFDTN